MDKIEHPSYLTLEEWVLIFIEHLVLRLEKDAMTDFDLPDDDGSCEAELE